MANYTLGPGFPVMSILSLPTRPPVIYLAGAIRDGVAEDVKWREELTYTLKDKAIILNPLAGKFYNAETRQWTLHGMLPSNARLIVSQDFWCVDHADIVVANLSALTQKYPNIGTLIELGRATARGCLIYTIIDPAFTGHENPAMFTLHPFLVECSSAIFKDVTEAKEFLRQHLPVLSGLCPHYPGST